MNPESSSGNRRRRRGGSEEIDLLSQESASEMELRKEKNRKAAQKCREKKEQNMKEIRQKNLELEQENNKLLEEKEQLERQWHNYMLIIDEHCKQGCKIPSELLEKWESELQDLQIKKTPDRGDLTRAVTMENNQIPPSGPDSACLNSVCVINASSSYVPAGPKALFSGVPLNSVETTSSWSRTSKSSSSSSSSASSPPSSQTILRSNDTEKDLYHFLSSTNIPEVLAPVALPSRKVSKDVETASNHYAQQKNTTNVAYYSTEMLGLTVESQDRHGELKNISGYKQSTVNVGETKKNTYNKCGHTQGTTSELQKIHPENEEEQYMIEEHDNAAEMCIESHDQETPQLELVFGMEGVEGYSYSEDLQHCVYTQAINPLPNVAVQTPEVNISENRVSTKSPSGSGSRMLVDVQTLVPGLINIGCEMSPSLQRQLMESYGLSTIGSITDSYPAKGNRIMNNHTIMKPGSVQSKSHSQLNSPAFSGQELQMDAMVDYLEVGDESSNVHPGYIANPGQINAVIPTQQIVPDFQNNQKQIIRQTLSQINQNGCDLDILNQDRRAEATSHSNQTTKISFQRSHQHIPATQNTSELMPSCMDTTISTFYVEIQDTAFPPPGLQNSDQSIEISYPDQELMFYSSEADLVAGENSDT